MSSPLDVPAVPLVDLGAVHRPLLDDLRAAFDRVVASDRFSGGEEVEAFEESFAELAGVRHAVAVSSGTSALQLALQSAGIGVGDEVILPSNSFFATAEAILAAGAIPVCADVDADTALLDPSAVEALVTPRTAAIVAVHLYGQPVDAIRFQSVAQRHGLLLLEDAAQAVGGAWNGRPVGALGNAAAFSFYPSKNLGALGEAGAVTTADPDLARRARMLRNHGEALPGDHAMVGGNHRMDALQAAFLRAKLPRLHQWQRLRDAAVADYGRLLNGLAGVRPLAVAAEARHVHHLMVVEVPRRDAVLRRLRASGVDARVHYPVPIHLQPACRHLGGRRGQLPRAEALARSVLSLPLFPGLTRAEIEFVVHALKVALEDAA